MKRQTPLPLALSGLTLLLAASAGAQVQGPIKGPDITITVTAKADAPIETQTVTLPDQIVDYTDVAENMPSGPGAIGDPDVQQLPAVTVTASRTPQTVPTTTPASLSPADNSETDSSAQGVEKAFTLANPDYPNDGQQTPEEQADGGDALSGPQALGPLQAALDSQNSGPASAASAPSIASGPSLSRTANGGFAGRLSYSGGSFARLGQSIQAVNSDVLPNGLSAMGTGRAEKQAVALPYTDDGGVSVQRYKVTPGR